MTALTRLAEWRALAAHRAAIDGFTLRDAFAADATRFERFSAEHAGLLVDWSKHLVTDETVRLLVALARARGLPAAVENLFRGAPVNFTENRPALHTRLRAGDDPDVEAVLARMRRFSDELRGGRVTGATGKAITDLVNIGIGGSDLGPALVCEALCGAGDPGPNAHFVSNVDGHALAGTLDGLDPATTLFIVASKTFTTQETLTNARSARDWIAARLGESAVPAHFCAVSANPARTAQFGIDAARTFEFWDWVGGRYSLWSAIGLPIALALGMDTFDALRAGARETDAHFRAAPLERNIPVLTGLLSVWYAGFHGVTSRAVLPYDERLRLLPQYLQQLEMESLGKQATRAGTFADYATAPVVWGTPGTDGQHAYFQLLHQGTHRIPADFIACCRPAHALAGHHDKLLANFFAQTEALAMGKTAAEAREDMRAQGLGEAEAARLAPHRVFPGNRPSTSILMPALTPRALGALIALYEHQVYVEGVVWDLNPFDQWGVELGKRLADRILPELAPGAAAGPHDASTSGLIRYYRNNR